MRLAIAATTVATIGAITGGYLMFADDHDDNTAAPDQNRTVAQRVSAIPGLGTTPADAARDDLIAAWQEWRAENLTADCMAAAGLSYRMEFAYSGGAIQGLAATYATKAEPEPPQPPTKAPRPDNEYAQTLYGVTLKQMRSARESGRPIGGCAGQADSQVPSIWDLRDKLEPKFDRARRRGLTTPHGREALVPYTECVQRTGGFRATSLAEVEARLDSAKPTSSKAVRADRALRRCEDEWANAQRKAAAPLIERVLDQHASQIARQRRHYDQLYDKIRRDGEFASHLAWATRQP